MTKFQRFFIPWLLFEMTLPVFGLSIHINCTITPFFTQMQLSEYLYTCDSSRNLYHNETAIWSFSNCTIIGACTGNECSSSEEFDESFHLSVFGNRFIIHVPLSIRAKGEVIFFSVFLACSLNVQTCRLIKRTSVNFLNRQNLTCTHSPTLTSSPLLDKETVSTLNATENTIWTGKEDLSSVDNEITTTFAVSDITFTDSIFWTSSSKDQTNFSKKIWKVFILIALCFAAGLSVVIVFFSCKFVIRAFNRTWKRKRSRASPETIRGQRANNYRRQNDFESVELAMTVQPVTEATSRGVDNQESTSGCCSHSHGQATNERIQETLPPCDLDQDSRQLPPLPQEQGHAISKKPDCFFTIIMDDDTGHSTVVATPMVVRRHQPIDNFPEPHRSVHEYQSINDEIEPDLHYHSSTIYNTE